MFKLTSRLFTVAATFVVTTSTAATYAPIGVTDIVATELIVKLAADQKLGATPAEVVELVTQANAGKPANFAVFSRLSSPVAAQWFIRHRLPEDYLATLRDEDPDHPELHLQEYLVLAYSSVAYRLAAEQQMKFDPAILSIMPNSAMTMSARVNDYFVSQTTPIVWERYQWALEAVNVMSPPQAIRVSRADGIWPEDLVT